MTAQGWMAVGLWVLVIIELVRLVGPSIHRWWFTHGWW